MKTTGKDTVEAGLRFLRFLDAKEGENHRCNELELLEMLEEAFTQMLPHPEEYLTSPDPEVLPDALKIVQERLAALRRMR